MKQEAGGRQRLEDSALHWQANCQCLISLDHCTVGFQCASLMRSLSGLGCQHCHLHPPPGAVVLDPSLQKGTRALQNNLPQPHMAKGLG